MDIQRFAKWLRLLFETYSDTPQSTEIDGLIEQALLIIRSNISCEKPYPQEEILWLAVSLWNWSCQCCGVQNLERANVFGQAALKFVSFLPKENPLVLKIQDGYSKLASNKK